ncbi:MAG: hypothetical protein U0521_11330 [Anaerolineae bacterium]
MILVGALLSIIINPLMFRAIPHTEQLLQRVPSLWRRLNCNRSVPMPLHCHAMTDHIIVIGYGQVGSTSVTCFSSLGYRIWSSSRTLPAPADSEKGISTLFRQRLNSEI